MTGSARCAARAKRRSSPWAERVPPVSHRPARPDFIRPFLKWAGGKYRLLPRIMGALPAGTRLVEPFVGSGAVWLNAPYPLALEADINPDLAVLYGVVREEGEAFIERCRPLFTPKTNTAAAFYEFRARFNAASAPAERAALLLYLNRHAYNGLVRYNAAGGYNVPFGRYKAPYFPEQEMRAFVRRARAGRTEFVTLDFRDVFRRLRPGDVVYADPPYTPLSATADFTAYAGRAFTWKDQADLARLAREAARTGVPVLISNHDTDAVRELYAGARLIRFAASRCISCRSAARRPVGELLALFEG